MAKILTGPLAAGLSGKLGPVVFHQTRFGQVVQSKAKGRVYTTPAALLTKKCFGAASSAYAAMGAGLNWNWQQALRPYQTTPQGKFVACYSRALRDGMSPQEITTPGMSTATIGPIQVGGPNGYFLELSITNGPLPEIVGTSWFELDPGTLKPRRHVGSGVGPGPGQAQPITPLTGPVVFIYTSSTQNPTGQYGQTFGCTIGPAAAYIP